MIALLRQIIGTAATARDICRMAQLNRAARAVLSVMQFSAQAIGKLNARADTGLVKLAVARRLIKRDAHIEKRPLIGLPPPV